MVDKKRIGSVEVADTDKAIDEDVVSEGVAEPKSKGTKYWKIQSLGFLFLEVSLGLILYPGAYAYITDAQKNMLSEFSESMVTFEEITEKEYKNKIDKQGLLGLG
jgi:hypothetical protein